MPVITLMSRWLGEQQHRQLRDLLSACLILLLLYFLTRAGRCRSSSGRAGTRGPRAPGNSTGALLGSWECQTGNANLGMPAWSVIDGTGRNGSVWLTAQTWHCTGGGVGVTLVPGTCAVSAAPARPALPRIPPRCWSLPRACFHQAQQEKGCSAECWGAGDGVTPCAAHRSRVFPHFPRGPAGLGSSQNPNRQEKQAGGSGWMRRAGGPAP